MYDKLLALHILEFGDGLATHTKKITATHEAGHAAIYTLLGFSLSAEIWEYDGYWDGRVSFSDVHAQSDKSKAIKILGHIVGTMAGFVAELVCANSCDLGSSGQDKCLAQMKCLGTKELRLPPDLVYNVAFHVTKELVYQQRQPINRLAKALMKDKKLNPQEVQYFLGIQKNFDGYHGMGEFVVNRIYKMYPEFKAQ
jgi:hypothetical protein